MIIRVFLPESYYYLSPTPKSQIEYLFGKVIKREDNDNVTVYIVSANSSPKKRKSGLQVIGTISSNSNDANPPGDSFVGDDHICFERNQTTQTLDVKSIALPNFNSNIESHHVFLYDLNAFSKLAQQKEENDESELKTDAVSKLLQFLQTDERSPDERHSPFQKSLQSCQQQLLLSLATIATFTQKRLSFLNSAFLQHFQFWSMNLHKYTSKSGNIWTIVLDVIAGVCIMLWLWHLSNADEYLLKFTMMIVSHLQQLLDSLKGSPVGLKLNSELNHFFLACFRYNVDLWAAFLIIVAPTIKYLFVPFAILGCFGLSFQLSMLIDLLNLVTLHAHCIYIYASILYRVDTDGLVGLYRIVSGRRKNILKGRMESYDYTNPQLYLSTIIFTAFLFLLPTFLVYYVVFACLQFGLFCTKYVLLEAQQKLITFPIYKIVRWSLGQSASSDQFKVTFLHNTREDISLFAIDTVRGSFPCWLNIR